jgi:uncharacterized protein
MLILKKLPSRNTCKPLKRLKALSFLFSLNSAKFADYFKNRVVVNLFGVNIIGLSSGKHQFEYELKKEFFAQYGTESVNNGNLKADVTVNKHETSIECFFAINGTVEVTCDRSLENFDLPLQINRMLVFKFGDEEKEISEDVQMILRDTATLDVGQPMYEYIVLAIPLKKIHPRFGQDDDETESDGKLIYSTETETEKEEEKPIDPRGEKLKKLK